MLMYLKNPKFLLFPMNLMNHLYLLFPKNHLSLLIHLFLLNLSFPMFLKFLKILKNH